MKPTKNSPLSRVPVRLTANCTLPDGTAGRAQHVVWATPDDARGFELRGIGRIEAACSITRTCRAASGGVLEVDACIAVLPVAHAEKLEAEGAVKILRSDAMIERHRRAWDDVIAEQKAAIARARQMSLDAERFAREVASPTKWRPSITWT